MRRIEGSLRREGAGVKRKPLRGRVGIGRGCGVLVGGLGGVMMERDGLRDRSGVR